MLIISRDRSIVADMANRRLTSALMFLTAVIVTGLNLYLLGHAATGLL